MHERVFLSLVFICFRISVLEYVRKGFLSICCHLKGESGVSMINDKIQDYNVMNGVSYFFLALFIFTL